MTFADLGLPPELLDAVTRMGFVTPTPIQAEAIPALLSRRDVVGIAQTGTGKTAAFGLPLLAGIDPAERDVQALVLAPTRELAMQSAQAMEDFAQRSRDVDIVAVYGGAPYGPQLGALRRGAQVVVGTPGRIIDLIERGALDLSRVRMLVLDEADEMLRMGFAEDVETIASSAPKERLTALFSATMPAQIERVANTHLHDPLKIAVSEESSTVDTIHQTYAVVPFKHKSSALARVLSTRDADAVLVFVRTRSDVEDIALDMANRGFRAAGISGDVAQKERERMVERLR
ncbi:MAG: DEAD/DEAH box helicase, partial [Actinomyces sp.]|nr:DEAD/DEAH box helicase [Actinomyces sp.]